MVLLQEGECKECGQKFWPSEALKSQIQFDHRPPLSEREPDGLDYTPKANDPAYIEALHKACHAKRTYGGDAKATTLGTDVHNRSRSKRLARAHTTHVRNMDTKGTGQHQKNAGAIRSRPWEKAKQK